MKPATLLVATFAFGLLAVTTGGAHPADAPSSQPTTDARISALEAALAALRAEVSMLAMDDPPLPDLEPRMDLFLGIPGIPGPSVRDGHEDEIEAFAWSWGARNPSGGNALSRDLVIVKDVDKASALLFLACADGTVIPEATLAARRTIEGETSDYLIIALSNVRITSVEHGIGGTHEVVRIAAEQVQMTYDGTFVAGWDFVANQET